MKSKFNMKAMLTNGALLISLLVTSKAHAQFAGWYGSFRINDIDIQRALSNIRLNRGTLPGTVDQVATPPAQPAAQLPVQQPIQAAAVALSQPVQATNGQGCVIQMSYIRGFANPVSPKIYKISDISQTDCVYINLKNTFSLDLASFQNRLKNYSNSILGKDSAHYTDPNDVPGISTAALILIEQVRADYLATTPLPAKTGNAYFDSSETYLNIDAAYGGLTDVSCNVTYQTRVSNPKNAVRVYGGYGYRQSPLTLMSTAVTVPEAACVMSSISNNVTSPDLLVRGNAGLQQLVQTKTSEYDQALGNTDFQNFNIIGVGQNQVVNPAQTYAPQNNYYNYYGYGF